MSTVELRRRARILAAAGPLLESRVDAESLEAVASDSAVGAILTALGWPDEANARNAVGFELYEAFGRCVPPHAGLFLNAEALAEGEDHLATPLAALSRLVTAEADAIEAQDSPRARRMKELQALSLDEVLLRVLPPFSAAVVDTGRALPIALIDLIARTVLATRGGFPHGETPGWRLPDPSIDLEDPETDVRAIAEWLSTPGRVGLLLSAHTIERIARRVGVPRGFGPRRRLIASLLQSAARYDALDDVVALLRRRVNQDRGHLARWTAGGLVVAPWSDRLAGTDRTLGLLAARVHTLGEPMSAPPRGRSADA